MHSAPPSLWRKLWAGDAARKSRLHDELGRVVPLPRIATNLPRALIGGMARLLTGYLPPRPWISYDAQAEIARFCAGRRVRMLEFGSGQSTRWYAERAAALVSLETDPAWHALVAPGLAGLEHVDYRLTAGKEAYCRPDVEGRFDLVMIDGAWRDECAEFALTRLAPGALIYLDNSDKSAGGECGDVPRARRLLIDHVEAQGLPWREFTDFAPAQFFAQRGLMVGGAG